MKRKKTENEMFQALLIPFKIYQVKKHTPVKGIGHFDVTCIQCDSGGDTYY